MLLRYIYCFHAVSMLAVKSGELVGAWLDTFVCPKVLAKDLG